MKRRPWTAAEDEELSRLWHAKPGAEVAALLGRSVSACYNRSRALGLSRSRVALTARRRREIQKRHARGWSDVEIAESMGCCSRATIGVWRRRMGLDSNAHNKRHRSKVAEASKRQCERMGLRSMAELRKKAWSDRARDLGWPDDLGPRHLQILDALYRLGPMSRREIVEAVGMPWKGSRASLKSTDPEGSYIWPTWSAAGWWCVWAGSTRSPAGVVAAASMFIRSRCTCSPTLKTLNNLKERMPAMPPSKKTNASIADLPAQTGAVPEWMQRMRQAAQTVVTEEVMEQIVQKQIVQKQIDLAKEGNPAAVKFVFEQVLGGAAFKGANVTQHVTNHHYGEQSEHPGEATKTMPGSEDRIKAMSARVARGESAFNGADAERDLS